ncbi:MAG: NADH-quinone oxidoreductase subunit H [Candidatus Carbobacillus altaicus]|nr:NADH-quinone oxidoreductase subunit H [Candidatus Carbobacillus altaicus]
MNELIRLVWITLAQAFVVLFFSPLFNGVIQKTKALRTGRWGAPVVQPFYDLLKWFKKDVTLAETHSVLTVCVPYAVFTLMLLLNMSVPMISTAVPIAWLSDVFVFIYVLATVVVLLALAALDQGGGFGALGSSREMMLNFFIEGALMATLLVIVYAGGTESLALSIVTYGKVTNLGISYFLLLLAFFLLVVAEMGRIPVDNPDTHLELTMVHEGMVLEYSGRYLSLVMWTQMMKSWLFASMFVNVFFPSWDLSKALAAFLIGQSNYETVSFAGTVLETLLGTIFLLLKMLALGIIIGWVETTFAKMRLFKVPHLLGAALMLALLSFLASLTP